MMTAAVLLAAVAAGLVGCTSTTSGSASPAAPTSDAFLDAPTADVSGLIPAQHPQCDRGAELLRYLATGDNAGDPSLDQGFAEYVGVPEPQARALASDWIEACNQHRAEQEAAAAAAQAEAAASADAARREAEVMATTERSCASIGGEVNDGWLGGCVPTVEGNPSGQFGADCASAWVGVNDAGGIVQDDLDFARQNYPGCFAG